MTMKQRIFLLFTALFLAAATAPAQEYVPAPVSISREMVRQNGKLYYSHVVLEKQTLYSIAKAYQVSVEDIYAANPSLHETGLRKNAVILIPSNGIPPSTLQEQIFKEEKTAKQEPPKEEPQTAPQETVSEEPAPIPDLPEGSYQEYTVRWFDTLYGISRKFGVPVEAIMAANGLTSNRISTGQVLRIPNPETAAVPEETPSGGTDVIQSAVDTVKGIIQDIKESVEEVVEDIFFSPQETVRACLLLPFNASGNPSEMNMDFYAGVLMAVRDLEEAGIHSELHVYDVANGVIPSQEQLAAGDFVLGPVSEKDLETVLQRTDGGVPVISPLDPKAASLLSAYPNLIQAPSPAEAQYADLAEWIHTERAPEDRLVLLTEKGIENTAGKAIESALAEREAVYSTFS